MIKILIADDQELIRESLEIVLNINPDMKVIGLAAAIWTERNIAHLVGHGLSNKEIAEKLSLSEGTVRNSLSTALSKLNLLSLLLPWQLPITERIA